MKADRFLFEIPNSIDPKWVEHNQYELNYLFGWILEAKEDGKNIIKLPASLATNIIYDVRTYTLLWANGYSAHFSARHTYTHGYKDDEIIIYLGRYNGYLY